MMIKRLSVLFLVVVLGMSFVCAVEITSQQNAESGYGNPSISNGGKENLNTSPVAEDVNHAYIEQQKIKEQILQEKNGPYKFNEPSDLFWKVTRHIPISVPCPETKSEDALRNLLARFSEGRNFSNDNVFAMLHQCENSGMFEIQPDPIPAEIDACEKKLLILLKGIDFPNESIDYNDIYRECYIQDYFHQQNNEKTLANYSSAYASELIDQRDSEFIDFMKYKRQYPTIDKVDEGSTSRNKSIISNNTLIEANTITVEPEKPSPTILNQIFTKIKNFFKWLI